VLKSLPALTGGLFCLLMGGEHSRSVLDAGPNGRWSPEFKTESEWATFLNDTRDWLKHANDQGDRRIGKFEAWVMLCRGLTKYYGMFGNETDEMKAFAERARERGLTLEDK
jgi:hypothetical protein